MARMLNRVVIVTGAAQGIGAAIAQRFAEEGATLVLIDLDGERLKQTAAATGKQPAAYLQAIRIDAAKAMLERENKSIQAISSEVGYDDVAFFRCLFKRATGMTPVQYRSLFAPMNGPQ